MFNRSARIYDAIYHWKNYARETDCLLSIIEHYRRSYELALLDVACGTGGHISSLSESFTVEGLDLDEGLLAVARERHPGITFHQADMTDFDLAKTYDVIVCLFSAIGYVRTLSKLHAALACMERHLKPGGVLIVEPWIFADAYRERHVNAITIDQPDLKISRMNIGQIIQTDENAVSVVDFYYQVGTPDGIEQFTERHELGLFSHEQYVEAFRASGLEPEFDAEGLMKRGLYVAVKPSAE